MHTSNTGYKTPLLPSGVDTDISIQTAVLWTSNPIQNLDVENEGKENDFVPRPQIYFTIFTPKHTD